jgi:ABC-type bacteriocin/lantibiotic exporter with double-glycine peptidase domain
MDKMKIKYYRQESGLTCGIACLRMALGSFGDEVTESELAKKIKIHSFGIYTTDLGLSALERGYKVVIYTFHLRILAPLGPKFGTRISNEILDKVTIQPSDRHTIESWKNYLKAGGELIWDYPKINQIRPESVININTAAINRFWKNWDNGHYLIIIEKNNDSVVVADPDPWSKNIYLIKNEKLIPAWSINARLSSGHLMTLKK